MERHREELRKEKEDHQAEIALRQRSEKSLGSLRAVGQVGYVMHQLRVDNYNLQISHSVCTYCEA